MSQRKFLKDCKDCRKERSAKSRSSLPPLYSHEELIERLSAPLPAQALKVRDDGLIDIGFAYQVERMNETFGLSGWTTKASETKLRLRKAHSGNSLYVVNTVVTLRIPRYKIEREQAGSYTSDNLDFALKGAITSATGKCFSLLGIASDVYKGLLNSGNSNGKTRHSRNGDRSLYLCGVETGYNFAMEGIEKGEAIAKARTEWDKDEQAIGRNPE